MSLDIDEGEASDLREALKAYINGLVGELTHADQRKYRSMLREKCERFERLAARLDRAAATVPAAGPH